MLEKNKSNFSGKLLVELHTVVKEGALSDLKQIISSKINGHLDQESTTKAFDYAIYLATSCDRFEVVEELIHSGAMVSDKLLIDASINGRAELVKVFINERADVDCIVNYGDSVLSQAALYGHTEVVRELILAGAKDVEGAIRSAVLAGETEVLEVVKEASLEYHSHAMRLKTLMEVDYTETAVDYLAVLHDNAMLEHAEI